MLDSAVRVVNDRLPMLLSCALRRGSRGLSMRVLVGTLLSWLVIAALGAPAFAQLPPPPPPNLDKLDPLLRPIASSLDGHSRVIVRATSAATVATVAAAIQTVGGTLGRQLPILDAMVADVPNVSLAALSNDASIQRIALDRLTIGGNDRTSATVGATAARQQFGYDGAGIGVAVIDSGVTSWHDDLTDPNVPGSQRVDQFVDFVNGQTTSYDDYGHGTHVAGIIAGNGFDSGGLRTGIAPAAHLVVLKVLDGTGGGHISDVIAAFDYTINHKDLFHIRVINLSVSAGVYESYTSDLLTQAAKRAVDQGIVVVAAAGNLGRDSQGHVQYGAITAPGNAPWVLTVGASSHMGTINRADDTIAAFSSRGPTAIDHLAKPDIVAPGVGTESLSAPGSYLYASRTQYLLSGTVATPGLPYLSLSGTSQATPVVSGTVALMLQANPALTPNAVKAILQYTAQSYTGLDWLTQGAGFLNARGAIDLVRFFASPQGGLYPWDSMWSGQVLWGNHRIVRGLLSLSANAWGSDVIWGAAKSSGGQNVAWGVMCPTGDCNTGGGTWSLWGASCSDDNCDIVVWGSTNSSNNVVWGSSCGGLDCQGDWTATQGDMVVWGSTDISDIVVWGSSSADDIVVWGSSCNDASCEPVVWGR
jgi:serine protease AprX